MTAPIFLPPSYHAEIGEMAMSLFIHGETERHTWAELDQLVRRGIEDAEWAAVGVISGALDGIMREDGNGE